MKVEKLKLEGLLKVTPLIFHDERGLFFENFHQEKFCACGMDQKFVQDNVSVSKKGVLRGLHFQKEPGQAKFVTCLHGRIWDVAVDLRKGSSTYGKWEALFLDDAKREGLFIPIGFAHGFLVLSERAEVLYKVSSFYDSQKECSIRFDDPELAIDWMEKNPILSERDRKSPFLKELFP